MYNFTNLFNTNIFNKKIIDLAKTNNIVGGGFVNWSDGIIFVIGIIIAIIGLVLMWFKNDLVETEAKVIAKSCINNNSIINFANKFEFHECKINIKYNVDMIEYSKIIDTTIPDISNKSMIKIYYSKSNPNYIQLYNPNYNVIGIGLIIVCAFLILFSTSNSTTNTIIDSSNSFTSTNTDSDIYSNLSNTNGFKIVYTQ